MRLAQGYLRTTVGFLAIFAMVFHFSFGCCTHSHAAGACDHELHDHADAHDSCADEHDDHDCSDADEVGSLEAVGHDCDGCHCTATVAPGFDFESLRLQVDSIAVIPVDAQAGLQTSRVERTRSILPAYGGLRAHSLFERFLI